MSKQSPMVQLRKANPVPEKHSHVVTHRRRRWRRASQTALAIFGVLALGTGVAWAASGENPVASLFSDDIEIIESSAGLDSLSILEPATQEMFDALPHDLAFRASAVAFRHSIMENLRNGDPAFTEHGVSRTKEFDPIPAELSAIGQGRTSSGSRVTVMAIAGEICGYLDIRGPGNCGSMELVQRGRLVAGTSERKNGDLWRVFGVVTDDVASIRIDGSDMPPVPVTDNMFEFRNMEKLRLPLIGLDDDGTEVFGPRGGPLVGK